MPARYQGGCHCGAVRYECTGDPELVFYCHCSDCQRTTGGPFSVEAMIPEDGFDVHGDMGSYTVVGDSGKEVPRRFCSTCGSGVYLTCEADPGFVFLKVGTLDDASWLQPAMHIFTASRQPWVQLGDELPRYEKMPAE